MKNAARRAAACLAAAAVSSAACVAIPFDSPHDGGGGEGSCTIEPSRVQASQEERFSLACAVGPAGLVQGGGFRIQLPVDPVRKYDGFTPPHTGKDYLLGKVTCVARREGRTIGQARVESDTQGELSCMLPSGRLRQGDDLVMEYWGMAPRAAGIYALPVASRLSGGRGGRWIQRPPALTVIARPARALHAVLPGAAARGDPFTLALAALDEFGNLDRAYAGEVEVTLDQVPFGHLFRLEDGGLALISGLKVERPGFARAQVAEKGVAPELALRSISNPIHITPSDRKEKVLWGDLHFQMCTGAAAGRAFLREGACAGLDEAYIYARDVANPKKRHGKYWARFNEPPRFVTLTGYRWRDLVVILPGDSGPLLRSDSRATDERAELESALEAIPDTGAGAILLSVGDQEPGVVDSGNSWGHPGCVDRPGLVPGCAGLIAVRAPDNTREAILAALRSGGWWATTGARIYLSIERHPGNISVAAAGTDLLTAVDLVVQQAGRSRTIHLLPAPEETFEAVAPVPRVGGRASGFVRAVQRDGHMAWSSTFDLEGES